MPNPNDYLNEYRARDTAALWRARGTLSNNVKCDVAQARVRAINAVLKERGHGPPEHSRKVERIDSATSAVTSMPSDAYRCEASDIVDGTEPEQVRLARKYHRQWSKARQRGITFELSLEDMRRLLDETHCWFTGMVLDDSAGQEQPQARTLDRVDASKGYTPENTVACSNAANNLKNQVFEGAATVMAMTPVQMLRMAQKMMEVSDD